MWITFRSCTEIQIHIQWENCSSWKLRLFSLRCYWQSRTSHQMDTRQYMAFIDASGHTRQLLPQRWEHRHKLRELYIHWHYWQRYVYMWCSQRSWKDFSHAQIECFRACFHSTVGKSYCRSWSYFLHDVSIWRIPIWCNYVEKRWGHFNVIL